MRASEALPSPQRELPREAATRELPWRQVSGVEYVFEDSRRLVRASMYLEESGSQVVPSPWCLSARRPGLQRSAGVQCAVRGHGNDAAIALSSFGTR